MIQTMNVCQAHKVHHLKNLKKKYRVVKVVSNKGEVSYSKSQMLESASVCSQYSSCSHWSIFLSKFDQAETASYPYPVKSI